MFFGVIISMLLYFIEHTCPKKKKTVISKVTPYEIELSSRGNMTSNLNLVNSVEN
jgi:hypothetical protein